MSPCDSSSVGHIARMNDGDLHGSERPVVIAGADGLQTEHGPIDGRAQVLKSWSQVLGEVVDSCCMSAKVLCELFESEITERKARETLSTLHLKATTVKVSDPIVFGHYRQNPFKDVFEKHAAGFEDNQVKAILGLGDALEHIKFLKRGASRY